MKKKKLKASVTVFVAFALSGIVVLTTTMVDILRILNARHCNDREINLIVQTMSYDADKETLSEYRWGVSSAVQSQTNIAGELIAGLSDNEYLGVKVKNAVINSGCYSNAIKILGNDNEMVSDISAMRALIEYSYKADIFTQDELNEIRSSIDKIKMSVELCPGFFDFGRYFGADSISDRIYKKVNSFPTEVIASIELDKNKTRKTSFFNSYRAPNWTFEEWEFYNSNKDSIDSKDDSCYKGVRENLTDEILFPSVEAGANFVAGTGIVESYLRWIAYAEYCFSDYVEHQDDEQRFNCEYEAVLLDSCNEEEAMTEMITKIYKHRYVLNAMSIYNSSSYRNKLKNIGYKNEYDAIALCARNEAVYDILQLLKGDGIPLVKTEDQIKTHHRMKYSEISGLKHMESEKAGIQANYKDYLRFFTIYGNTSLETTISRIISGALDVQKGEQIRPDTLCFQVATEFEFSPCSIVGIVYEKFLNKTIKSYTVHFV